MKHIGGVLVLVACGSSATPTPPRASEAPASGVFMTPETELDADLVTENELYVSVWQEHGEPVVGLLCRGPCLPNARKKFSDDSEALRGEHLRAVEPRLWEVTMLPKGFPLRLDLRAEPPKIEFGGRARELRRLNFQDAAYHLMDREAEHEALLFVTAGAREVLIKPAPPAGNRIDDTFLYLAAGNLRVQTLHASNWHYQRVAQPSSDEPGSYFAVLHGDVGDATLDLDILRTPESDVAFMLSRAGKPGVRFLQTNDSNTRRFEACVPGRPTACQALFIAAPDAYKPPCPHPAPPGRIAILLDLAGNGRMFSIDDKDRLLDAACKAAFGMEEGETKVVLRGVDGSTLELAAPPAP